MRKDKNERTAEQLFRSRLFRRLFASYVILILVFLIGTSGWYLVSYSRNERESRLAGARQSGHALATEADRTMLTAKALCSAVDTSESFRNLYQTIMIEKTAPDSMQLYRTLGELTRIKASAGNLDVYSVLLGFTGDRRLYAPGTVIPLNQEMAMKVQGTLIAATSAAELLNQSISANIMINKRFLIYAEPYMDVSNGSAKGVVMVLLDPDRLRALADGLMDFMCCLEVRNGGTPVYQNGAMEEQGEVLEIGSVVNPRVVYRMQISEAALRPPFPVSVFLPLLLLVGVGCAGILLMYQFLRIRYTPIGRITRMVKEEEHTETDDLEDVIQGITTLISERNGYREKMITISPYASHGALHQLLSGNLEGNEIQVLRQEQFLGLRNRYYMVGLVNLHSAGGAGEQRYLDARALTARALEELNTEEMPIAVCPRDLQNLYVVVNGDDPERMTALFYRMLPAAEEAMDDGTMAVTLGVSRPGTELELLREACLEASAALENMILGGRKSVYFYEAGMTGESREYVFPGDLRQRMVKALREGQEQELSSLMDGLWEKNFRKKSLSPEAVRQLVDDLHACVNGALGEISEQSTTHIRAERIREPATIEEIFAYYRSTLTEAVKARREIETGNLAGEELETAICDYVVSNALDPALSLSAVADHFGVSGKMVGSVCKNRTGKTYLQIVHDCRIQESVRLLEETDLSLEEISERCGFGNVLTFRRNFKAAMNKNPSDFRRE